MQSANVASKLNPIKFLIEMLQFLAAFSIVVVIVGVLVLLSSNNGMGMKIKVSSKINTQAYDGVEKKTRKENGVGGTNVPATKSFLTF